MADMLDLTITNEWQHIDPRNGLVMPWYTKPALDEISTWQLKDKTIFEYGLGASTLWWANKASLVYGVDMNEEYMSAVRTSLVQLNTFYKTRLHFTTNIKEYIYTSKWYFDLSIRNHKGYDILIVDDAVRDECILYVLRQKLIKPGGKLIVDNWNQPEVYEPSSKVQLLMQQFSPQVYSQEGHQHWKTAIFTINNYSYD